MNLTLGEFIQYVVELDEWKDQDKKVTAQFLETFLPALENEQDFVTSLAALADWLGTDEHNMRKLLARNVNYKEGVDFITQEEIPRGGRPKKTIRLSADCLKRLAMQSRAPNAEQVRSYFILMEKMYREFMQQGIENRQNIEAEEITAKKRQGPRPKPTEFKKGHCVYVIEYQEERDEHPRYKIGRTKDLNRRASEHWRLLPGFVKVIYHRFCPAHRFLEICAHTGLRGLEVESEKFITDPNKAIETIEFCMGLHKQLCDFTQQCGSEQPI